MEHEAHDYTARKKDLTAHIDAREFSVEGFERLADARYRQPHTRAPGLESIKMLRRRKGGGDAVKRCGRSASDGSMKTGVASGATSLVQSGGTMPARLAASSTIAVT